MLVPQHTAHLQRQGLGEQRRHLIIGGIGGGPLGGTAKSTSRAASPRAAEPNSTTKRQFHWMAS
ncbi:MAG: hypothetical protein WA970_01315 [Gammaproteobacteria bacterium]